MHNTYPVLSPARRAQRCRTFLGTCALLAVVAGPVSEWARADIFRSAAPQGRKITAEPPPATPAAASAPPAAAIPPAALVIASVDEKLAAPLKTAAAAATRK
jgi:hypothetical protein